MPLIYEPKGRAREYSPLALNVYRGCPHECGYCYVRNGLFCRETVPTPRADPDAVRREAAALVRRGVLGPVLLSFYSDPYPRGRPAPETRVCLEALLEEGMTVRVLSKSGSWSTADHDLLALYPGQVEIGATLTLPDEDLRAQWEPGAAPHEERVAALRAAVDRGIPTFASIEPVVDVGQSIEAVRTSSGAVGRYNVGWINHTPGVRPDRSRMPELLAAAHATGAAVALKRDAWDVLASIGRLDCAAGCALLFDPALVAGGR
jgi:hypothetical protein